MNKGAQTNNDFMVVCYGYELVYGLKIAKPLEVIATEMGGYSLRTILVVLMKVALTFLEDQEIASRTTQTELIKGFFPLDVRRKIVEVIKKGESPRWTFFSEQALYSLVKIALEHAGNDDKDEITDERVEVVGRWFLLMNDAGLHMGGFESGLEVPMATKMELVRGFTTRQFYLRPSADRLAYRLCRYIEIVKFAHANKHRLDVDKIFKEASGGVDIKTFLDVAFFLATKWAIPGTKKNFETGIVIERNEWFSLLAVDQEKVDKVLSILSFTPEEYASQNSMVVSTILKGKDTSSNYLVFMQRPLIKVMDTRYICPFSTYLAEKTSTGVYWAIENFLRRTRRTSEHNLLPVVWGDAFEGYVITRLRNFAGDNFHANVQVSSGEIDGILCLPNITCMIEAKAAHLSYLGQLNPTKELLEPYLNQLIGKNNKGKPKGLGQITRAILDLRESRWRLPFENHDRRFLPIIVTEETVHIDAISRNYYEHIAQRQGTALQDSSVLPFIILDVAEVEFLEAIGNKSGIEEVERLLVDYSLVFSRKLENDLCRGAMSFRNYLSAIGYETPENEFLKKAFDRYDKDLRSYFSTTS
jgi:hypothetical protein